jgi:rRNA maturation endonuclease Nob1
MWIGISLAISLALSLILDFPYNLVAIIAVFLAMNYFMRQRQLRRMGMTGSRGFFGTGTGTSYGQRSVKYSCMMCGARHNGGSCPNCGSKLKRASFED